MSTEEKLLPDLDQILRLAAIVREVDGAHNKGAASLAEAILSHGDWKIVTRFGPDSAEGRLPLTDEELVECARQAIDGTLSELLYFLKPNSFEYEYTLRILRAVANKASGVQQA